MRNDIVELDDQRSDPPVRRADRAIIAGLLTASAVFAIGVWIARPAVDSRLSSPLAPAAATSAPAPATATSAPSAPAPANPARPEGRRDVPVFIRPTFPPGASVPISIVIYRIGPDGTYQIDVPRPSPGEGVWWQAVPDLPGYWRTP